MNKFWEAVAAIIAIALTAGYALASFASLGGNPNQYSAIFTHPIMRVIALLILMVAVGRLVQQSLKEKSD